MLDHTQKMTWIHQPILSYLKLSVNMEISDQQWCRVMCARGNASRTDSCGEPYPRGAPLIGQKLLDRYVIIKHIGGGGMAQVYLAQDEREPRKVAIKVMNTEHLRKPRSMERFRREGKLLCRLHHANLVQGYETGKVDDRPFIVMEYVDGPNVEEIIGKRGTLSYGEALKILLESALALDHLHREGNVQAHRDIKPTNIMVTETGTVKITDFGISKALDEAESMTLTASFLGSPHYMAPEQILDPRSADIRTDLYALGAVYFEMITGDKAYPGTGTKDILDAHFELDPPRVDGADPLVGFSNELLARLLSENPSDRFQSPAELVRHLASVVSGDTIVSVPRFARSSVRLAVLVSLLTLATAAILGFVVLAQPSGDEVQAETEPAPTRVERRPVDYSETTATAPPSATAPKRTTGTIDVGGASASGISANEAARKALSGN